MHRTHADGVPVHFVEHSEYFDRPGIYNDENNRDYEDNAKRFGFLSRAALQLCVDQGFEPDVVHANDWQTALAPAYLVQNEKVESRKAAREGAAQLGHLAAALEREIGRRAG